MAAARSSPAFQEGNGCRHARPGTTAGTMTSFLPVDHDRYVVVTSWSFRPKSRLRQRPGRSAAASRPMPKLDSSATLWRISLSEPPKSQAPRRSPYETKSASSWSLL